MSREEKLISITESFIKKLDISSFEDYSYWMMDQDVYFEILQLIQNENLLTQEEIEGLDYFEMPKWANFAWDKFERETYGEVCG